MAAEKNFENRIKDYLDQQGVWYVKFFANAFTKVGIPDLICCAHGRFVGIEVKAPHGRPSKLQLRNLKRIDKAGGYAVLLYPDQFDQFKNLILHIGTVAEGGAYMKIRERWVKELASQSQQD